jgi:glycosyltransferase involved in cell wall biosynthesis
VTEPARTEPEAVVVAYVHQNEVAYSWHHSMTELLGWDWANHGRVLRGGYIGMRFGSDGLVQARNKAVQHFLADGKAEWLFWIDTDMGFAPDTVDRLLEAADPVERPVVGGLCFTQTETDADGLGGWRCRATPTVFDWAKLDSGQMGFAVRWGFTPDTLTRVGGTGSACILIHRSVFEKIEAAHGRVWYDRVPNTTTGQLLGEDLSFCLRAGALQVPMFVHTGVRTTHLKATWLAEEDYWQQRALTSMQPAVVPATERTAVIVPVLGRPQNAAPFMESLRASGAELAKVYAIADPHDEETVDAWIDAGAGVIHIGVTDRPGTFAEKVNFGYHLTDEPWLFIVGDDVRFAPGWLDHAQAAARDGYDVIGTNDLHNPRVTAGEHGTHLLIRRSYVDEQGASWDGPKVVAHEGYRHWWVDQEIVDVAKQRGTWTSAPRAIVEHLHPLWGGADDDDTYRLGRSSAEQDRALFEERLAAHVDA